MGKSIHRILGFIAIQLLAAVAIEASITGSISGTVKDPSGAVIPKAEVTVTEVNTSVTHTTHTDDQGSFSFLALPVGHYRLSRHLHSLRPRPSQEARHKERKFVCAFRNLQVKVGNT